MDLLKALTRDAYAWVNDCARKATKEIMNGLAEAGPEWSGEFKDSWVAHTALGDVGVGEYPYTLRAVPRLPATRREAMRRIKYTIENTAPHAAIAMDLVDVPREDFRSPGFGPQGDVVARGGRPDKGRRGDVSGKGQSTSTAPLDWYPLYAKGGKMQKALIRGVDLAKPDTTT